MAESATFKVMSESTQQDWNAIMGEQLKFMAGLSERILDHMKMLDADYGGFAVDRLQHCLQTAELAAADGRERRVEAYASMTSHGARGLKRQTTNLLAAGSSPAPRATT